MRSLILLSLVAIVVSIAAPAEAVAQSGSRGGVGGGVSGGGSSIGGFSGGLGFGRPNRAQRWQQSQQLLQLQQAQAQENARLQAARAKQQHKQSLVRLGLAANRSENLKQNRVAFQQAKRDFSRPAVKPDRSQSTWCVATAFPLNRQRDQSRATSSKLAQCTSHRWI